MIKCLDVNNENYEINYEMGIYRMMGSAYINLFSCEIIFVYLYVFHWTTNA